MNWSYGLGRQRTKLGKYIDLYKVSQDEISKQSGLGKNTLTRICSDPDYIPSSLTRRRVLHCLQSMGYGCSESDFW